MVLHNGQPSQTISLKAQNASAIVFSEMRDRHTTAKMVFLVLALVVYSSDVLPQQRNAVASEKPAGLRFGQSVALSDFDSDGFIDEARVDGSGSRKGIKIPLSGTGKLVVLD